MIHHDIESAHKGITEMLGGTVFGNILNVTLGFTILMIEAYLNMAAIDIWAAALIKIGSIVVIIFGIRNGHLAYKKNKIELKKLENDQSRNSGN
jgi:Ca2+/Na+ antiporter